MKYILILFLGLLLFSCGQNKFNDSVDDYDRFDLANTVDTTKGTYNPRVDSTYIFPADSSDIVAVTDYLDYEIKTTIFPVKNKYLILYRCTEPVIKTGSKIKYRDYKLQIVINNHKGLQIKKVITKYDFSDSIFGTRPKYDFIRAVKFKGLEKDEFRFDIKFSSMDQDKPTAMVKYYVRLTEGQRFENYPKSYYDSLNPEPDEF